MKIISKSIFLVFASVCIEASFEIKKLTKEDTAQVAQVCQLFDHEDIIKTTSYNSCDIARIIEENKKGIIVAQCLNNQQLTVAGVIFVSCLPKKLNCWAHRPSWDQIVENKEEIDGEISCDIIAVHPYFSDHGITNSLINYVEQQARLLNVPHVTLSAYEDDKSAIACYEEQDFIRCSKAFDLLVFRKQMPLENNH